MLCQVCRDALEGMWRPENRLARIDEYLSEDEWIEYSQVLDRFKTDNPKEDLHEVENYIYGHHKDVDSLSRSILEGCLICKTYFEENGCGEDLNHRSLGYLIVFYVIRDGFGIRSLWELEIRWVTGHVNDVGYPVWFVPVGGDDSCHYRRLNLDISASTESDQAWSIVKRWVETCTSSHDKCQQLPASNRYMPTRVLELTHSAHGHFFRLVSGPKCPAGSRYITLSHCWGKETAKQSLKLLNSTVRYLSQQQSVEILPKTFRDAITICERFGIKYLWIDRLCIYQDSDDDWQMEASSMQHVYKNGFISISALGASNSEEGCFFDREPAAVIPSVVGIKLNVDSNPRRFVPFGEMDDCWRRSFENEPLLERGWILQERLLAPRVLHFGSKQLFWECRQARCCETHPEGLDILNVDDVVQHPDASLWKGLLGFPGVSPRKNSLEQVYTDWNSVVDIYAGCKLTKPSDKLVALSGLANDLRVKLESLQCGEHKYLAGLWEAELANSLTWMVLKPAERPEQYRAPSWSWASLDAKPGALDVLEYARLHYTRTQICSVIRAETETVEGGIDTGEVTGGSIVLEGPMITFELRPPKDESHNYRDLVSWNAGEDSVQGIQHVVHWSSPGPSSGFVSFDTMEDDRGKVLVLIINEARRAHDFHSPMLQGLALRHIEDSTYKRIGSLRCSFRRIAALEAWVKTLPRKQIKII